MQYSITNEVSSLGKRIRDKAQYMRLVDANDAKHNWEQSQSAGDVLIEVACWVDTVLARYYIHHRIDKNNDFCATMNRHIKSAIKKEISRQNAPLCRQARRK